MPLSKKLQVIALSSIMMLSLSGCVIAIGDDDNFDYDRDDAKYSSSWESREKNNRAHIQHIQLNTAYLDITNTMGVADFNEIITTQDVTYQVLYYRTQRQDSDGLTTKDECTPLVFNNGLLVGWGEAFVRNL